jgi:hypothetical protein
MLLASGQETNERTIMGNASLADELATADELEELYELNASEPAGEDDTDDDDTDDDDTDGGDTDDGDHPDGMPVE